MKSNHFYIALFLSIFFVVFSCEKVEPPEDKIDPIVSDLKGKVVTDRVFSKGLESNLLGDNPERMVSIYLPAEYEIESSKSYPVLYLLHGFLGDHSTWFGGQVSELYGDNGLYMKKMLDTLIQKESIEPLIVVCPSSYNSYEGSWYTNSIVTGEWEDFIVQDLVSYIDNKYRTLPVAESRGIAGHSMGAYGAMKLAMKNPDIFSSVFAMSGSGVSIETMMKEWKNYILAALQESSYPRFSETMDELKIRIVIAMSVALAPNPATEPFMGEFPYDEDGIPIDSTWQKWLNHDPISMLDDYSENMQLLEAIRFDCGNSDEANLNNRIFSDALTSKGIEHEYETYSGDHLNKIPERIATEVLPFFSEYLDQSKN